MAFATLCSIKIDARLIEFKPTVPRVGSTLHWEGALFFEAHWSEGGAIFEFFRRMANEPHTAYHRSNNKTHRIRDC
jgi:hypothetical protein